MRGSATAMRCATAAVMRVRRESGCADEKRRRESCKSCPFHNLLRRPFASRGNNAQEHGLRRLTGSHYWDGDVTLLNRLFIAGSAAALGTPKLSTRQ